MKRLLYPFTREKLFPIGAGAINAVGQSPKTSCSILFAEPVAIRAEDLVSQFHLSDQGLAGRFIGF